MSDEGQHGFLERARLRRRARRLEREREIELRDVGGLVFELHRAGRSDQTLVGEKLDRLSKTDAELRALQAALDSEPDYVQLREAGIASCPNCGAIVASDDSFCSSCGAELSR